MTSDEKEVVAPPQKPAGRRGQDFGILVAGGVLAGAIGFFAAMLNPQFGWFADKNADALAAMQQDLDAAQADLARQQGALTDARARIDTLSGQLSAAADQLAAAEAAGKELPDLATRLTALGARVTDLENRPIPDVGATQEAVDAYERELTAMRDMFAAELDRIEAAQAASAEWQTETVALGRQATVDATLSRLEMAVEAGSPVAPLLQDLANLGVEVPAALASHPDGVPSLSTLQTSFPDAARQAIEADIRARADSGELGRVEAFLRLQVGQRSLTPKDGDDADAVLSRAEAALTKGDVTAALAEVEELNASDAPLMADWIAAARAHDALRVGVAELRAQVNE